MGLTDDVWAIRKRETDAGIDPATVVYQGVTKDRIRSVLTAINRQTDDMVLVVNALLDDQHDSWFSRADFKFCAGASTAHLACHVGILQRGQGKMDREGRDYWIKPLRELGAIDAVSFHAGQFIAGHPVAKSSNSAYKLNDSFRDILLAPADGWRAMLGTWSAAEAIRDRAAFQAAMALEARKLVDTKHSDLINASIQHYATRFLPGFEVVYVDDGDGDRIEEADRERMAAAGLQLTLDDAMPDVLLWNKTSNWLWVIEAVTSDGEVDAHKQRQLQAFAQRSGKAGIGFTTSYRTWKDAATRQDKNQNLAVDTYIWIMSDAAKHFLVKASPQ